MLPDGGYVFPRQAHNRPATTRIDTEISFKLLFLIVFLAENISTQHNNFPSHLQPSTTREHNAGENSPASVLFLHFLFQQFADEAGARVFCKSSCDGSFPNSRRSVPCCGISAGDKDDFLTLSGRV